MKLHDISIKRPVAVLMCVCIIILFGVVSLMNLAVDLFPEMNIPIVVVSTTYEGVGPKEVENLVTIPIENVVATVGNVDSVTSTSSQGNSLVVVEFVDGTDMDFAALEVREKVDLIKKYLPSDADMPTILKVDPSMMAVASFGITGSGDEVKLKTFVEDRVKPRLEKLEGVASVNVSGGKTREVKIEVDPDKMSGYGISFEHIANVLRSENLNLPGGSVEYGDKNLIVRSRGEFETLEQIENIAIPVPGKGNIYLRDVAEIIDDFKTVHSYTRMNGERSIGISIQKQATANTVTVVESVKKEINRITAEHPEVDIVLAYDQAEFITDTIDTVVRNAVIGGILAIIVLFVFLKNIRTTFIVGTAIPVSIIATFSLMYFGNLTLNMISLGGLALGIGMLVDNAIVVIENIYRYRREGHGRMEAARLGTQEVGGAVVASTLTTIGVFLPILFTEGMIGEIFKELSLTVMFSLLASLVVALTLIPMLSSKFLRMVKPHEANKNKFLNAVLNKWDDLFNALAGVYGRLLSWALGHRKTIVFTAVGALILALACFPIMGFEFMPKMDQGQLSVSIELPQGTVLEETDDITNKVEQIVTKIPEADKIFVTVGGSGGFLNTTSLNTSNIDITLKPLAERNRSADAVADSIRTEVENIPGADIKVNAVSQGMGGSSGSAVSINIKGDSLERLEQLSQEVKEVVKNVEGTRQVESSIADGSPEAQIYIDRDKASYYGLSTAQVGSYIRTAMDGQIATRYKIEGDEIDVRIQYPEQDTKTFEQLKNVKIMTQTGSEVALTEIARIDIEKGPVAISRDAQQRVVSVTADVFGRDIGSVNNDIQDELKYVSLPDGYAFTFGGEAQDMTESFQSLAFALLLAVILVYMIMAAQFESLLHPFTIMFSVPLAFVGSVIGLVITNRALSVPGFIGVIMLAGIVVNNAIVLVDYINTLRKNGMERLEAILKAGPTRLKPILMTTLTTVLGLVPMALGIGEGAETQAPMATVVIGGLLSSTVLTLVVIPVIYTLFDDIAAKAKAKKTAQPNQTHIRIS